MVELQRLGSELRDQIIAPPTFIPQMDLNNSRQSQVIQIVTLCK